MNEYVEDLSRQLEESGSSDKLRIRIESNVTVEMADVETAIPLGLIINELITNAIKYSFAPDDDRTIFIKLWEEDKILHLVVSDNGSGADVGSGNSTKFSSQLIDILCKKLKGTIQVNQEVGYTTSITFERYKFT